MKRAIIVHGWGGTPLGNWFPWLRKELESRNLFVEVPEMPNTEAPEMEHWVGHLAKFVDEEDENIMIGHSMGVQAVLRYLEKKPEKVKVKGAVLVAGFVASLSDEITRNPQDEQIAKPWLETPINLSKVSANAGKIISIVSDNDPYIPEDNWAEFEKLGEVIIQHGNGHIQNPEEKDVLRAVEKIL
jgi:hypothetical protein